VNQLFTFFTTYFYEILFIVIVFALLEVALFFLSSNKKDKVIVLHASWLINQALKKLTFL